MSLNLTNEKSNTISLNLNLCVCLSLFYLFVVLCSKDWPTMELCLSSTTATTRVLNLNSSRPFHTLLCSTNSLKNPLLQFKHRPFTSLKLPSPSRQFHLLQPQPLTFPPIPSRFTASASSSVATGNEKDQLPADIEVKETPEPNCSVSFWVTSLYAMFSHIISGCVSLYYYHCFEVYLVLFNWVFVIFF